MTSAGDPHPSSPFSPTHAVCCKASRGKRRYHHKQAVKSRALRGRFRSRRSRSRSRRRRRRRRLGEVGPALLFGVDRIARVQIAVGEENG